VFLSPAGRIAIGATAVLALLLLGIFAVYYVRYSRLIDRKLRAGPFQSTSMVFSTPRSVSVGDELTPAEVIAQLRSSGYGQSSGNRMGWYHLRADSAVEIFPGPDSFFDDEAGVIKFSGSRVSQIISLRDNTDRMQYLIEPELITNLSDRNREKRRLVKFSDIPEVLVNAVISAEDKHFFQHAGFDPLRIIKTAYVDVTENRRYGASTLSMQVARMLWLNQKKTWSRKAAEALITLELEQKLNKQQIFEFYSNQVPLGRRGSFDIHGFGEASRAYFGKDVGSLTLPEAATLAGLIQKPSARNPYRRPEAARERRNKVLDLMKENGYITEAQYVAAATEPLKVTPAEMESTEAPYFVDLVNEELQSDFGDYDFQTSTYRVYTTLDLNLQRAASEAVRMGMQEVDQRLSKRRWPKGTKPPQAQCALVALDPETGQVKALIGGRDYGASQLNRALAKRQPGSSFKPFVFAAALATALGGGQQVITPVTRLMDEPTTFWFDGRPYSPENFKREYQHGEVSIRYALAHSLNVPTVRLAEMVGYDTVEALAKRAGMNLSIHATPSMALGAYEVTPLEVAGAYTIYADQGMVVKPNWISLIRDRLGNVLFSATPDKRPALDPRVAYMMSNLMEEVLRSGTGAGVRAKGFNLPAAGKTGTSHDGWFVGFTTRLICAVWVGFDDNRELGLEGAHSALPIWAEFMKKAHQYREYRNVHEFRAPDGIVTVEIDPGTGQLATPACPKTQAEVFLSGTQPVESCQLHGGEGGMRVASWETAPPPTAAEGETATPPPVVGSHPRRSAPHASAENGQPPQPPPPAAPPAKKDEKKKGFFHRIWGVFK
jgi:penicillin-binding protein 1B